MAKKLPEVQHTGLGDITEIMHNSTPVTDYSWLAVNEEDYRESEALPRQNLDTIPELTAALTYEKDKDGVPSLIPLRPHTTVNSNPLETQGPSIRPSALTSVVNKTAAYIVAGLPAKHIQAKLQAEFSPKELRIASPAIREVLQERGVLGNVYINAKHFPRCAQEGPHKKFVARHASRALFILAKDACAGCVHHKCGRCEVFKKRIVSSVPYGHKTLAHYAPQLVSEKRLAGAQLVGDKLPSQLEVKEMLRSAFNRTPIQAGESPRTIQHHPQPVKPKVTEKDYEEYWARQGKQGNDMPGPMYLVAAKRMMLGKVDPASIRASSDLEIRKLANEYGILGYTYLDADALGTCNDAIRLIAGKKLTPDFVIARYPGDSEARARLSQIVPVLSHHPGLEKRHFIAACERALREKRMTAAQVEAAVRNAPEDSDWTKLVAQANLYQPPAEPREVHIPTASRGSLFYGGSSKETSTVDPDEVYRFISRQMNLGLSGSKLQAAVLSRFTPQELKQVPEVGKKLASGEGVQGVYYIDPSVYSDYGKGCVTGAKQFRKQGAAYLLAFDSCTGCVYQTAPSWCSKYCKRMIRQAAANEMKAKVEQQKKQASQIETAPVENPVVEYELVADMNIDLDGSKSREIDISLPSRSVTDE